MVMFRLSVILFLFGRYDDPNSAQSSFSMLLGNAPHLDRQVRLLIQRRLLALS